MEYTEREYDKKNIPDTVYSRISEVLEKKGEIHNALDILLYVKNKNASILVKLGQLCEKDNNSTGALSYYFEAIVKFNKLALVVIAVQSLYNDCLSDITQVTKKFEIILDKCLSQDTFIGENLLEKLFSGAEEKPPNELVRIFFKIAENIIRKI